MEPGLIFAFVWSGLAIVGGAALLFNRHRIAQLAREDRERRGGSLGSRTQTPGALGIAGGGFLVIGIAVMVLAIVGASR